MRIGIGIGIPYGAAQSAGGVSIPGMFASGEKGFAYDMRSTSGLYQDSGRTTPVTANNDPIGGVTDQSGLGNHALNSGGTARPLWQSAGYVLFDGTNDYLQTASIDLSSTGTVTVFAKLNSLNTAGTSAVVVYEFSSNYATAQGGIALYLNDTAANRNTVAQHSGGTFNIKFFTQSGLQTSLARYVMPAADASIGLPSIRVNGAEASTTTSANSALAASVRSNNPWYIGARAGSSLFLNMRMYYALAINRALTAAEIAYLEAL